LAVVVTVLILNVDEKPPRLHRSINQSQRRTLEG
jgi:hypothetical protein